MPKKLKTILLLTLLPYFISAQTLSSGHRWYRDWSAGFSTGVSLFATEIKKDFSKAGMDMNSNLTGAFSLHLDKRFPGNFGLGIDFEKNFFSGDKTYPNKMNWLMYDVRFNNEISHFVPDPVYFKTNVTSMFINMSYNFPNFNNYRGEIKNFNIFIRGGIGFTSIGTELGYKNAESYVEANLPNPIYEKGQGVHSIRDFYPTLHGGGGVNYYISPRFSLSAELMMLFISCDYLDGVQNYEASIMPGQKTVINRMEVYSMIPELKVGVKYYFNWFKRNLYNSAWEKKQEGFKNPFFHGEVKVQTAE